MDRQHQNYNQSASSQANFPADRPRAADSSRSRETTNPGTCRELVLKTVGSTELLTQLNSGQLLMVDNRRRNGVIIYKRFHAEFAGPGAAVGGFFDVGVQQIVPVGDLSLVYPEEYEQRQKAYTIRRHWVRLTEQLTENPVPLQRAQMLLTQFEHYFDRQTIARVPDEAFASLVGVLPHTMQMIRQSSRPKTQRVLVRAG